MRQGCGSHLIDVRSFDVSVVSEPAYPDTTLSLRTAPKEIRSAIESRKLRSVTMTAAMWKMMPLCSRYGLRRVSVPNAVAGDCDGMYRP